MKNSHNSSKTSRRATLHRALRWGRFVLALGLTATPAMAQAGPALAETRFVVKASRSIFSDRVDVVVRVDAHGNTLDLDVELEDPVRGCRWIDIQVRVNDAAGNEVGQVPVRLHKGERAAAVSFDVPAAGQYRLLISDRDMDGGKLKLVIKPDGTAFVDVVVPDALVAVNQG
jgi:hypothetical protein